jgi:hypothetical protein
MTLNKDKLLEIILEVFDTAEVEKPVIPTFASLEKLNEAEDKDLRTFPIAIKHMLKYTVLPNLYFDISKQWHSTDLLEAGIEMLAINIAMKIIEGIDKSMGDEGTPAIKRPRMETWRDVVERIAGKESAESFVVHTEYINPDNPIVVGTLESHAWQHVKDHITSLEYANEHFRRNLIVDK